MTIFFFWLITDSLWENRKHFFIRLFFTITSAFVQFFLPLTYTKWLQANFSQHHSWNRAINSIRISFYSTCSSKLFFSSSISVHVFTVNFTPYNGQASQWTMHTLLWTTNYQTRIDCNRYDEEIWEFISILNYEKYNMTLWNLLGKSSQNAHACLIDKAD